MNSLSQDQDSNKIIKQLNKLDKRISRIEKHLELYGKETTTESSEIIVEEKIVIKNKEDDEDKLEFEIGQFWFAKIGIIIFFIGIAFLMSFPFEHISVIADIIFGYLLSIVVFFISRHWRESYSHLSGYLLGGGLFLFFFTTLRLKFFGNDVLITGTALEVVLLSIATGISFWIALKRDSNYLILLSLALGYVTAIVSENPYSIFVLLTIISSISVYFKLKRNWQPFLFTGILLTYFTHFLWFMNNPILGNTLEPVHKPAINLLFLLIYSIIFAMGNRLRKEPYPEDTPVIFGTILNAAGCYGIFLLITFITDAGTNSIYHLLASITFLSLAILFWQKEKSRYSTFVYAMLGYFALSVAIIYQVKSPGFFILLCWQSVIVISTAIWFRSKFIILANFVIYILIIVSYLVLDGKISGTSISFGIVALISARILNWKKDRLELTTEQMRNAYLLTALAIIPYALFHAMPAGWASVSWIGVAIVYYVLSVLLKSKKYRWMALSTLGLTVGYVFVIGVTNEDPVYKIVSFLALGFVMLIISILYSKMKKGRQKTQQVE